MFVNRVPQTCFITEVIDQRTNKHYLIHIIEYFPTAGLFVGCTLYEVFLTDPDPLHDYLVGVFHKAFIPNEMPENEQMDELQRLLDESFLDAVDKFEQLLNIY